jgi:hypothetical protein
MPPRFRNLHFTIWMGNQVFLERFAPHDNPRQGTEH